MISLVRNDHYHYLNTLLRWKLRNLLLEALLDQLLLQPLREAELGQTGLALGTIWVAGIDRDLDVVSLLGVGLAGRPLYEGHPAPG